MSEFKNEVLFKLKNLDAETLSKVSRAIDQAESKYEITKKETGLVVRLPNELPEPIKYYLVSRKMEGISEKTAKLYKFYLHKFFDSVQKPLDQITTNDIRVFLFTYQDVTGISNLTLNTIRSTISAAFAWMAAEEYIPCDPTRTIKVIKYERRHKSALTQIELEQIRHACRDERETALIEFLYSTGCRISEAIGAKISDIDWNNRELVVLGKGNKHRTVYLNAKSIISLKEYLLTRSDDTDSIFVGKKSPHLPLTVSGAEYIIKTIVERCPEISKTVSPHVFRHTTATVALSSGMAVQDVQKILGHSQINTTMVYADVSASDVKSAHKKFVV